MNGLKQNELEVLQTNMTNLLILFNNIKSCEMKSTTDVLLIDYRNKLLETFDYCNKLLVNRSYQ